MEETIEKLEKILEPLRLYPKAIAHFSLNGQGVSTYLFRKYRPASLSNVDLTGVTSGRGKIYFADDEFDLVVSFRTLLWNSHDLYLRELMRICKPGGRILLVSAEITELCKLKQS